MQVRDLETNSPSMPRPPKSSAVRSGKKPDSFKGLVTSSLKFLILKDLIDKIVLQKHCVGMQNTSHAVMSQRVEALDSLDDFPTPPWATRALMEHVIGEKSLVAKSTCLEPACGVGHMAKVLKEYFKTVVCADIHDYGYGQVRDFLTSPQPVEAYDWVITNPPFRLAEDFVLRALQIARTGVAILARTVFLESSGRYRAIFQNTPPHKFAQFVERVPMIKGRVDKSATTATGYCWLIWDKRASGVPQLVWVPPCRKALEREGDYDNPQRPQALRA